MQSPSIQQLIQFLQDEFSLSAPEIDLVHRRQPLFANLLPIALWQQGMITTEQLSQTLDWLEAA